MRKLLKETLPITMTNIRILLCLEIFYKSAFLLFMIPLFGNMLQKLLAITGYSYLTIHNLSDFLLSPFSILCGVIVVLLFGFFVMMEAVSLIAFFISIQNGQRLSFASVLIYSLKNVFLIRKRKFSIVYLFVALLQVILFGLPFLMYAVFHMRLSSYLLDFVFQYKVLWLGCILFALLLCVFVFRSMFLLFFYTLEEDGFQAAYQKSNALRKGKTKEILEYLCVWNILVLLASFIFYLIVIVLIGFVVYQNSDPKVVVVIFTRLLNQFNLVILLILFSFLFVFNYALLAKLFIKYNRSNMSAIVTMCSDITELSVALKKSIRKKVILLTVFLVICFNCYNLISGIYYRAFVGTESLFGTFVTAHRGASHSAPENTLEALRGAIESYADFSEIDVQQTKDGIVVLLHDSNLKRICGIDKNIWDVTYEELTTYDAGKWFSKEFTGTHIPTLKEAISLCSGKIKLNIEIKITSHEIDLVEEVVRILKELNFENDCVLTSTNYSALARVKKINTDLKTGFILSLAYGYFYDNEYADFFSVKSSFINEDMVKTAHSLGKEIHAWTVNQRTEAERLRQLGVDNIITDRPVMVREILDNSSSVSSFRDLMRVILK